MLTQSKTFAATDDASLISALRMRDESAFVWLVGSYHASLVRLARSHVSTDEVAEEVVQETWLGALNGIDRFERRSSLKTWIFRILLYTARTRGVREHRCVPTSALSRSENLRSDDAELFSHASSTSVGWLTGHSRNWEGVPEDRAEAWELRQVISEAIENLPPTQREVIILRDVQHFSGAEICSLLDITVGNQRVLLHRARTGVRQAIEMFYDDGTVDDGETRATHV